MTETDDRAARVFVYGSCVARDTLQLVAPKSLELKDYVARQSLLSAGNDARPHRPPMDSVRSKFQRLMINRDFVGSLYKNLTTLTDQIDLLLWDITDERHGVHRFDDGTYVTRSIDNIRVPEIASRLESAEYLAFGSDEHFALWKQAAAAFTERLRSADLLDRTVVLQVPWALRTSEGRPTPWSMGMRAPDANRLYEPYYRTLSDLGHDLLEVPQETAVADPNHRWGLAPFHYVEDVYLEVLRGLHARGFPGLHDLRETS